jgi:hypothetical protein
MPNSLKARLKKLKYQGVLSQEDLDRIIVVPKGATNGDMILKVFPNAKAKLSSDANFINYTLGGFVFTSVDKNWWKAPYKEVQDD